MNNLFYIVYKWLVIFLDGWYISGFCLTGCILNHFLEENKQIPYQKHFIPKHIPRKQYFLHSVPRSQHKLHVNHNKKKTMQDSCYNLVSSLRYVLHLSSETVNSIDETKAGAEARASANFISYAVVDLAMLLVWPSPSCKISRSQKEHRQNIESFGHAEKTLHPAYVL